MTYSAEPGTIKSITYIHWYTPGDEACGDSTIMSGSAMFSLNAERYIAMAANTCAALTPALQICLISDQGLLVAGPPIYPTVEA